MKTRVLCLIAAGMLSSVCLFAQTAVNLKVTVPFGFQAAGADYPAGEYTIARMDTQPIALLLKAVNGKGGGIMVGQRVTEPWGKANPRLIFNRYAGTYFLSEVWGPEGQGNRLGKTREEKEFASRMGRETERTIVAAASK